jgi:hypothetical protein
MLADLNDLFFSKEIPHRELLLIAAYHLPGAIVLGGCALFLRVLIEEILRHVSHKLAIARIWTIGCVALWLGAMLTTSASDSIAKKLGWNKIVTPPGASAPANPAPAPGSAPQR